MRLLGLITEYNPFHNGHKYHLDTARASVKPDAVVAVMSGHFLQRGEPAIMDKWTRAKSAVEAGVDLVVELPTYFSTASAEGFSIGSVALLDRMGVSDVVFGSECGDVEKLSRVASLVETPSPLYQSTLARGLDSGFSYPAARQAAIEAELGSELAFKSNNILGIEYLRAIQRLNSGIKAHAILRIQNDYNNQEVTGSISSATAVRQLLKHRPINWDLVRTVVPETTYRALWNAPIYTVIDDFHHIWNSIALREGPVGLNRYRDVSEGLENKLFESLSTLGTLEDMIKAVKSKRYTLTRIQRVITAVLLGVVAMPEQEALGYLDYARVLAFNERGAQVIRQIKKREILYPITNLGRDLKKYRKINPLLELDIRATGMYAQVNHSIGVHEDFTRTPFASHL